MVILITKVYSAVSISSHILDFLVITFLNVGLCKEILKIEGVFDQPLVTVIRIKIHLSSDILVVGQPVGKHEARIDVDFFLIGRHTLCEV